jgi:hypothetical protein
LKNRYILDLTARRDGSSRFGPESRFHNFESVAGGWIFTEESLFKKNLNFLSFGKLKASYGTTGSDQIGDYVYLNLFNPTGNIDVSYQGISSLSPTSINNPYLEWEETKKLSMGLNVGLIQNRILLDITYARNRSSNQLISYALPTITGFAAITENYPAKIQNTNWEFLITTNSITQKNFSWSSSINLTIPKNKLLEFPNISESLYAAGTNGIIVGQPLSIQKGYNYLGIDPATGRYIFSDRFGNPTFSPNFLLDRTALINTLPKYYGGLQNTITFKRLELDFLFQVVKQLASVSNLQYLQQFPGYYFNGGGYGNQPVTVLDRWQKPGDNASIQRFSTTLSNASFVKNSTAGYEDASFIRLKNMSVSWQLPQLWNSKMHIRSSRLYAEAQNIFTITNYTGLDPENHSISSLPPLRIITMGIQLGL